MRRRGLANGITSEHTALSSHNHSHSVTVSDEVHKSLAWDNRSYQMELTFFHFSLLTRHYFPFLQSDRLSLTWYTMSHLIPLPLHQRLDIRRTTIIKTIVVSCSWSSPSFQHRCTSREFLETPGFDKHLRCSNKRITVTLCLSISLNCPHLEISSWLF